MRKGRNMKSLTIALNDLRRSFRSTFALLFMFVIPLLVTGMFFVMFGNIKDNDTPTLTAAKVALVNLDTGNTQTGQLGQTLVDALQSEGLTDLMEITLVKDAAAARELVDTQQAGVAIIIPENFSDSFSDTDAKIEVEFIQDPTLTLGPQVVRSVVNQVLDGYAGIKITVAESLKLAESGTLPYEEISRIVNEYMAATEYSLESTPLIEQRTPAAQSKKSPMLALVGPIMAGMMIFYAFFTGANSANSILHEDEEGTLQRMLTTPTAQAEIMRGKIYSVGLTVIVQIVVLMLAARLIFGIQWGTLASAGLSALAIAVAASTFGIMLVSLIKNTKQSGVIFGGFLTVTGMLGMANIFTGNPQGAPLGIVPLFTPQGWATRAILATMDGAAVETILPFILVMFAMSILFFVVGVWRLKSRFA
jgi:ABC-2 type transport system permease protein